MCGTAPGRPPKGGYRQECRPFLETLPPEVDTKLQNIKPSEEEPHIQVATDLTDDGTFGEQWLVVTDERLFVIPTEGHRWCC